MTKISVLWKICVDCGPKVDNGGDATHCLNCWEKTQIRAAQKKFLAEA